MMMVVVLAFGLFLANIHQTDARTGVCYGMMGNNLPTPQEVVALYQQNNIQRMRIYGPNSAVFQALKSTNIELMLDVSNPALRSLASSQANAKTWVQRNVQGNPNIKYVLVGNEVRPDNPDSAQFDSFVLPAMLNVHAALTQAGFGNRVKVSTAFDMGVIGTSYPPSAGSFNPQIGSYLNPIIRFLADNGCPLMMNVYPYFSYIGNTRDIRLDYALFTAPGTVVTDPGNGLRYQNLFDAMVDSVHSALERAGARSVPIVVSETGWPTAGGAATSVDNARTYNNNLIRHVKIGTPKRYGRELETYIFAMFNENRKSPDLEKHWGLFFPSKQPKYPIRF